MIILFSIIGICLGSFYCCLAYRLPKNESIIKGVSHCDNCKKNLKFYDLIPIISYLLLRGKCRYCKKNIPVSIFISELATGVLFALGYHLYGISYELFAFLIISSLVVIIFISDFKYLVILDSPLVISSLLIVILKFIYFD